MKFVSKAIIGASFLALAACGGQGDDSLGDNVAESYENKADALEEMADNTSSEAQSDAMENQAEALRDTGEQKEEAIDNADVNASTMTDAQKNAMGAAK